MTGNTVLKLGPDDYRIRTPFLTRYRHCPRTGEECSHTCDLHAGATENARRADLERVKDFHERNERDGLGGDINGLVPRGEDARDDAVQHQEQNAGDDCCKLGRVNMLVFSSAMSM